MQDSYYKTFHEVESHHWWFVARREILLAVAADWLKPGASILDIGCGTGYFLEKARERYAAEGLDASPLAVEYCRERGLAGVGPGSALDPQLVAGRTFDGIFMLDVIEHLGDEGSALRNARALLAEGGKVFITVPAFMFLWTEHDELNHHKRRYTARQLEAVLQESGFALEKISYFNSRLFPLIAGVRLLKRLLRIRNAKSEFDFRKGWLNSLLRGIFSGERRRLKRGGYSIGVSILAIARAAAPPVEDGTLGGP